MSSFSLTVILLSFFFLSTATARTPNVPWRTQKDGERFLSAFTEAMSDELQEEGISDLKSLFEGLLSVLPQRSGRLSVAKLQAVNMAFASIIAKMVAIEGKGSTERKIEVVREALNQAFQATSGFKNPDLIEEILSLINRFCEEQEDNERDQNLPQEEYPGFITQVGSADEFEIFGSVTAGNTAQQVSTEATQSSSTTQTYSGQTASSTPLTSVAITPNASSFFIQHLTSLLIENPKFVSQYNSIASSGPVSPYASTSAENVAYSIGQGSIASLIASAVSRATADISAVEGPSSFVQASASALAQILSTSGVLNWSNVIELANAFGNSLFNAISTASSATSGWSAAGSQISTLQTSSAAVTGAFASSGAADANYAGIENPFLPAFGAGDGDGLNNFDFLTPLPGISGVPSRSELSPYSSLISGVLHSPSGLTSSAAKQRISSLIPLLVLSVNGNGFNASLFSNCLSSLVSQISQSTSLSPYEIFIETILECISALLNILASAKPGVVSTDSQAEVISSIINSVFNTLSA